MLNKKRTRMDKEYTEFDVVEDTREYLERVRKTSKPTIEEFENAFDGLGFSKNGNTFSRSVERVVGKMVVNGAESLHKDTLTLEFRYSQDDLGEIDGDTCSALEVSVAKGQRNPVRVFEETVYTRPEELHVFTDMYLKMLS